MGGVRGRTQECDRARAWVSRELDGELSEFERVLLAAHVADCAPCRSFKADVAAITAELRSAPLERLGRRVELPLRRRLSLRPLQAAAAAMAVMAVGLGSLFSSLNSRDALERPSVEEALPVEQWVERQRAVQRLELESQLRARQIPPRPGPQVV